jgi:F-type H+-transporting ATPase subunit delta
MRAASRESYLAARDVLVNPSITMGDELLAFARLLAREPRLRRALSDPSRQPEDRATLVRGLLQGKVGDEALAPLETLASGRWSATSELLDAAERLAVDALLGASDQSGDLAEVEDELFRFGQIVSGDSQLASTVGDSSVAPARRATLVRELLEGPSGSRANPVTVKLAELAVEGFGGRSFAAALTRLVELVAQRRESEIAYVTVAEPLADQEENRLAAALSRIYGKQVSLKLTVDPSVMGGMSVRVGSDLYDGTVARRLATVRNALAAR